MDSIKKSTLLLIEKACSTIKSMEQGRQLLLVAYDYLEDNDLESCKRILSKISYQYYKEEIVLEIQNDKDFANKIAQLMEVFGVDLDLFANKLIFNN